MGQTWELINVDRRERELAGGSKLVEFFFDDMRYVYQALQTPILPEVVDEWLAQGTMVLQPGGVGKLSTEVLDMIFQEILDNEEDPSAINLLSCICFALGCKRLLTVGKQHILDGLIRHHGRAADCRLICLGESTDSTDQAPPGMLTEDEIDEIAETKVSAEDDEWAVAARNEEGKDPDLILERCMYEFAMEFYNSALADWQERRFSLSWERTMLWERLDVEWFLSGRRDPAQVRDRRMVKELAVSWGTYPPGPNVLLNLVKGEYVREAALIVRGKDFGRVSLAHAMLSRICYSRDPSVADEFCGEEFVGDFGRGPWAGDRFCIQSEDDMPEPQAGCGFTEWVDVTEEVNRLLDNLWRAMHWGE